MNEKLYKVREHTKNIQLPSSNVLQFICSNGGRIMFDFGRPPAPNTSTSESLRSTSSKRPFASRPRSSSRFVSRAEFAFPTSRICLNEYLSRFLTRFEAKCTRMLRTTTRTKRPPPPMQATKSRFQEPSFSSCLWSFAMRWESSLSPSVVELSDEIQFGQLSVAVVVVLSICISLPRVQFVLLLPAVELCCKVVVVCSMIECGLCLFAFPVVAVIGVADVLLRIDARVVDDVVVDVLVVSGTSVTIDVVVDVVVAVEVVVAVGNVIGTVVVVVDVGNGIGTVVVVVDVVLVVVEDVEVVVVKDVVVVVVVVEVVVVVVVDVVVVILFTTNLTEPKL